MNSVELQSYPNRTFVGWMLSVMTRLSIARGESMPKSPPVNMLLIKNHSSGLNKNFKTLDPWI